MAAIRSITWATLLMSGLGVLSGCMVERPAAPVPAVSPDASRTLIGRLLPPTLRDREGWAADIYDGLALQGIDASQQNVCAVLAVVAQESGFQVNPVIPELGKIAWKEIDARAAHAGIPPLLVHGALQVASRTGRSYADRIDAARTEKDLSDIYEDFIAAVPLGNSLFEERNPIRTRGPMQVSVAFAEQYQDTRPYPFPVRAGIADELFTRRGSLYFGIAHLLAYSASYPTYLYRFADYNAGQYSSRNAAFQAAVGVVAGVAVARDGALIPRNGSAAGPGGTESALLAAAVRLDVRESEIHGALEQERTRGFEDTRLYRTVFARAEQVKGAPLPRALLPRIDLHGPKISRRLTTAWYAERVNQRFEACERR